MSLPDQTPRLPKWPFFIGDAALLLVAWYTAHSRGNVPLVGYPLLAVVLCVALGAILAIYPLITDYAWSQDKALDERQRGLEALSRTTATSAEQISIAAAGLHEIADLAQKNLKQADALPQKLQDKIAEFKVQTASTRSDEIEELEREITALRASENDKLESAVDKVTKAIAEFGKAETAIQKQFAQAGATLEKTAKAQAEALAEARSSAVSAIAAAAARAVKAIEEARPAAPAPVALPEPEVVPEPPVTPPSRREEVRAAAAVPEPAPLAASADTPAEPEPGAIVSEPPPIAITPQAEVAPVAPSTPPPFPDAQPEPAPVIMAAVAPAIPVEPETAHVEPAGEPVRDEPPAVAMAKTPRKRAPKKAEEPALGLDDAGDFSQAEPEEAAAPESADVALSSDGATRILVTAYIGIGNRLFLRGEGPGLSWEKGVPLQFVSIGKWRWESSDAAAVVKFRLFKNDADECAGLGERAVEPGHQLQLAASF